jgi:hypothetical protein
MLKYSIHFRFVNLLPGEERLGYFMQDYVSPRTTKETTRALLGVSGELHVDDRLISKGLRPPRSQNLFKRIQPCLTAEGRHSEHHL